ncbi:MAG: hypothetical protein C7B46_04810 [Sulfobacillus benefaciens]|uniref:Uncharacterized protein n=1 Tax=Sulfobacillus benefaciens TaxID=453960 RepID=A0A2T2XJ28_9FIRM|nr:MAG: hypothetical protein C7B46_04810 [Sulfobacillus benefaciens]
MDPELKAYFDGIFRNLSQQIAQSRQENHETRHDLTQQIAESREHAERLNQETRHDLIDHMDRRINETHVLIEDVRHEVQLLAEGIITIHDQLGRILADHEERITRLERRGIL